MATYKIVKVSITRKEGGGMQYPARYKAKEVDAQGIGPAGTYSGGLGRGEGVGHCLIVLPNDLADEYAADPGMEIITAVRADALMEKWRQAKGEPAETIQDLGRIQAIQAKLAAGMRLSQEDQDALDPSKSTPGINRTVVPFKEKYPGLLT